MTDIPVVVRTAPPDEVLRKALAALDGGARVVMATVLRRKGSAPSTPGQKIALVSPGEAVGTIGGGAVELRVLRTMLEVLSDGHHEPRVERYELGASIGMCCGGAVEVMIEPLNAALEVLVVGAGHVGGALAPLLASLGFRTLVCDDREGAFAARALDQDGRITTIACEHDDPDVRAAVGATASAAAVVMTHDHQRDQAAVEWALRQGFAFVGGVGSRAKAARTRQRLEAKGFAATEIERVRMPIGNDVPARSPMEIAVAIAAELIAWRADLLGTVRRKKA